MVASASPIVTVEAPYLLEAANQLHVNLAWMVMIYNASETLLYARVPAVSVD